MAWWEQLAMSVAAALAGYIGGGWYQKRKAKASAEKSELDNLKDIIDTWREAYGDLKHQREEYNQLWTDLTIENQKMKAEIHELSEKVKKLQSDNTKLRCEIDKLKSDQS